MVPVLGKPIGVTGMVGALPLSVPEPEPEPEPEERQP